MMDAATALAQSLSKNKRENEVNTQKEGDPVGNLARVYEIARNALEYRADHLVKRAAIERILRRELIFNTSPETIAEELFQELSWAKYINEDEKESEKKLDVQKAISKGLPIFKEGKINRDWLLGLLSAEIEEIINPSKDYQQFTNFAFYHFRNNISLPSVKNPDLLLLVALDKVYAQSDEARIAFHLYRLIAKQNKNEEDQGKLFEDTYQYYTVAEKSPWLPKLISFIRKRLGPMILIRDMYFSQPGEFLKMINKEEEFKLLATNVLEEQLTSLKKKMNTATMRSLIYVFLTKMLLVVILERPTEKLLGIGDNLGATAFNVVIPVLIMWILTYRIKLPKEREQETIINTAWKLVCENEAGIDKRDMFTDVKKKRSVIFGVLYYIFYTLLFYAIFALIWVGLSRLNFTIVSKGIFLFFLSVVTFFAYRIRQFSLVYTFTPRSGGRPSLVDLLVLPIVVVGGWLSKGVSRLNFLVFFFDFILESPFKIILRFLDAWFQFLSTKRDEAVG